MDRPTSTLHCYKKIISTLVTLPTTQSHLHFVSSLARAPRHRSSTRYHTPIIPPHNDTSVDELAGPILLAE
jgi:hypothetical protein